MTGTTAKITLPDGKESTLPVVVGVEPLWSTRRAASLLLTAASVILVLLNAAYKDGDKVSEYGLAALVTGGAAAAVAKTGLFKGLLGR